MWSELCYHYRELARLIDKVYLPERRYGWLSKGTPDGPANSRNFLAPLRVPGVERMRPCVHIRAYSDGPTLGNTGAANSADRSERQCADRCALHACAEYYTYGTADGRAAIYTRSNRACGAHAGAVQLPDWDAG